jgi:hypothetical protein
MTKENQNKVGQEELYNLLRSKDFNSAKIADRLAINLEIASKIAKQTSKEEFIGAMNGQMPAVKLTPAEMELVKGGKNLAAMIEGAIVWVVGFFHS